MLHYHADYAGPAGTRRLPDAYITAPVAWMELHTVVAHRYLMMSRAAGGKLPANVEATFNVTTTSLAGRERAGTLTVRDPTGRGDVRYAVTECHERAHL